MSNPTKMIAVVTVAHGGLDQLEYRDDVPVPKPGPNEVLVRVGAAGLNNVDVKKRQTKPAGTPWGRIQGCDVAGHIVAVGTDVDTARINQRVLVEGWVREGDPSDVSRYGYVGLDRDGGFAQFMRVHASSAWPIQTKLSDVQLATFPVAYSTAENMITRVSVAEGDVVLVPGASGGVGGALVQLAKRRGAVVVAIASTAKIDAARAIGADHVLDRETPSYDKAVREIVGSKGVTVVADPVGGPRFPELLNALGTYGRYVTPGPLVVGDVQLSLNSVANADLALYGATLMGPDIFKALVGYIEREEIRPVLHRAYPLSELAAAQTELLARKHAGKIVVVPPA